MYNLGYKANWNDTYSHFTVLMVFLNCTINPFIYLIKYRDYQEALRVLCGWQKQKDRNESNTYSSGDTLSDLVKGQ